jgi:hypothetical protein
MRRSRAPAAKPFPWDLVIFGGLLGATAVGVWYSSQTTGGFFNEQGVPADGSSPASPPLNPVGGSTSTSSSSSTIADPMNAGIQNFVDTTQSAAGQSVPANAGG